MNIIHKIKIDALKEVLESSDVVFLALPHKVSMQYAAEFLEAGKKVIDLSADYRLPADVYEKWYGTKHIDQKNLKKYISFFFQMFQLQKS